MKRNVPFLLLTLAAVWTLAAPRAWSQGAAPASTVPTTTNSPAPVVQIAILLDTSGSMQGLIDQARGQLWKIVNEFINARHLGRQPELEVALFEYGKQSLPAGSGYVRLITPLTNDLDRISEELFKLTTNGGDEYCGWVIRDAVERLAWSSSPSAFKAIFIAGNEPFTQGPVNYADACAKAASKGIIVNTIHCGTDAEGRNSGWFQGAQLADGKYLVVDHNRAVVHYEAPQDKEITRLGMELNRTYIGFGVTGQANLERQAAQDLNSTALALQGSSVQRALSKSSAFYCNSSWDLVDACRGTNFNLATVRTNDLPEAMRSMTVPQREAYVRAKSEERAKLQAEIGRLNAERQKYVAEQERRAGVTNTLDAVVVTAVREQAARRNFDFNPAPATKPLAH